jgi:hypothetical protein
MLYYERIGLSVTGIGCPFSTGYLSSGSIALPGT